MISVCSLPLCANAETSSGIADWLSRIFSWQTPVINHVSDLFESRRDNLQNNSIERNQLLNWRRGIIPSETASTVPTVIFPSDTSTSDITASSSPVFISESLFKEEKTVIVLKLTAIENGLNERTSQLAAFVASSSKDRADTGSTQAALLEAETDVDNANSAVTSFADYEPDTTSPSKMVDLQLPQAYLDAALRALHTAQVSLESAITGANDQPQ